MEIILFVVGAMLLSMSVSGMHELFKLIAASYYKLGVERFEVGVVGKIGKIAIPKRVFTVKGVRFVVSPLLVQARLVFKKNDGADALSQAPPWAQVVIAFAGPIGNLVFALACYFFAQLFENTPLLLAGPNAVGNILDNAMLTLRRLTIELDVNKVYGIVTILNNCWNNFILTVTTLEPKYFLIFLATANIASGMVQLVVPVNSRFIQMDAGIIYYNLARMRNSHTSKALRAIFIAGFIYLMFLMSFGLANDIRKYIFHE